MYSSTYMEDHVAAAQNRSHQWCLTRPQTILKQLKEWRHCFLQPIIRDLTSSSCTTVHGGEDGTPKYLHVLQPPTLRFPFCSLKNFCDEIKVILRFNTLLFKDEIGNLRLISRHIYSKRSDWETATKCLWRQPRSQSCYPRDTGLTSQATRPSPP